MIMKRILIKRMKRAIDTGDYGLATEVATRLQDHSYKLWVKHREIPEWIRETLKAYNTVFGFMKQDEDDWGDK